MVTRDPIFKRRTIVIENGHKASQPPVKPAPQKQKSEPMQHGFQSHLPTEDYKVLVVNSSHDMAKEMTMQLQLGIPGCSIMYAPSIELAKWILGRKQINLVVASPILPDGSITKLRSALEQMSNPPDVVVIGDMSVRSAELMGDSRYEFAAVRRLGRAATPPSPATPQIHRRRPIQNTIRVLGEDIRNDLNNPLQEIVAMVFVAQAGGDVSAPTTQALDAIESAARNMAKVVNDLEAKIRRAVEPGY